MSDMFLDPRLKADTIPIGSLQMSELLLMNDSRWYWVILVPKIEDAVEWHELHTDQRQDIDFEIANVAAVLKGLTGCDKINTASLGNVVSQLHIHLVARTKDDTNWPNPVWGHGEANPYDVDDAEEIVFSFRNALDLEVL